MNYSINSWEYQYEVEGRSHTGVISAVTLYTFLSRAERNSNSTVFIKQQQLLDYKNKVFKYKNCLFFQCESSILELVRSLVMEKKEKNGICAASVSKS